MTDKEFIGYLNGLGYKGQLVCKIRTCNFKPYDPIPETEIKEVTVADIIDLINRLETENENYSHNIKKLTEENMRLRKENLILSQKRVNLFERIEIVNNARVKTIKEVEEMVDKTFSGVGACGYNYVRHKIHCVLKEMVGEDE